VRKLFWPVFLAWLLPVAGLAAQPLADDWWRQDSPEKVLARAQATNQGLAFFHGEKSGSTSSQITNPFAKTNEEARTDFFQRRNADGSVETKRVILDGKFNWTDYKLKSGDYAFTGGQIIKMEYAEGEDGEKPIAAKFDHPYEFKVLKSEMAGTNKCIVIARCMTPKFLDAIKAVYYKDYTKEQEAALGGDFRKFIRSEIDYYVRKNDAVIIGHTERNHLGEQLEDRLYDKVEINQPIPDQEFSLPKGDIKIAKSSEECQKILGELRAATRAKTRKSQAAVLSEKRVSELPWATDLPKALAQARAANKIVLLDFTGSDWCVWCMKFGDDVLSKPEFAAYARTNLELVLVDFPKTKNQNNALKKTNDELQTKFKVEGFPTYVALNADGKEIGRQVGYLSGGPQAFIAELEKFRKQ
jgi:thioredoxin-related protein